MQTIRLSKQPEKILFLFKALIDPFIFSGFFSAFIASLFWMAAMKSFTLSYAYPFMSLSFIAVLMFSNLLLNEQITSNKIIGVILISAGVIISSKTL
jgi:drug/metabolite transporter (DMT)-like permease